MAERVLTRPIAINWGVGEIGIATYVGITMSYMLYYLTEVQHVTPAVAGLVLLIPRLWDAAIDPLVGLVSDRTQTRWGRRRPFLLGGSLSYGLFFGTIFLLPPGMAMHTKLVAFVAAYMLTSTAFTFYDVAYSSMAAEMARDYRERTLLVGYKMMAARVGILIAVVGAPAIFNSRATLADGFALMGIVAGLLMLCSGLWAFVGTRAAPQIDRPIAHFNVRAELRAMKENRPFLVLWSVFLFQNLAVGANATIQIYLVIFVMKIDKGLIGVMIAAGAASAMLVTPLWVRLATRFGKSRIYSLAITLGIALQLPVYWLHPGMPLLLFLLLISAGIADAATQLCPNAMVPDTVEYDELRSGERREGAIFGMWLLARKLGMAGGAFFASLALATFGFAQGAENQTAVALHGIRLAYVIIPSAIWLLALILLRFYRLDEDSFNDLRSAINAREITSPMPPG